MKVLLIEDDLSYGAMLMQALKHVGMDVVWMRTLADGLQQQTTDRFDAALLDIELPDGTGVDILKAFRAAGRTPVLMISARQNMNDKAEAFQAGADDYIVKPFAIEELILRMNAVVRRSWGQATDRWQIGELTIDLPAKRFSVGQRLISLSPREERILVELVRRNGQVVTRHKLEHRLFSEGDIPSSNALDVHIHHLRRKIHPVHIETFRGIGYMLAAAKKA